jgi:hypothetical protein
MTDRLWTVHDVSVFLGVPVGTLYQWRYMRVRPPAIGWAGISAMTRQRCVIGLDSQDTYGR